MQAVHSFTNKPSCFFFYVNDYMQQQNCDCTQFRLRKVDVIFFDKRSTRYDFYDDY
jgi:hypothetical protein